MEDQLKKIINFDSNENQQKFVFIIKSFPILLEKSMLPEVKKKRSLAIQEVKGLVESDIGVSLTEGQLWTKLQNMKYRLKRKADVNKTGNKKIILKPWEEEFLNFLESDENPSIVRVKGAVTAGTAKSKIRLSEDFQSEEDMDDNEDTNIDYGNTIPDNYLTLQSPATLQAKTVPENKKKKLKLSAETEETKHLSTPQLQRLVLLEQLKTYRKVQELLDKKLNNETTKERDQEKRADEHDNDPSKTFDLLATTSAISMSLFPGQK